MSNAKSHWLCRLIGHAYVNKTLCRRCGPQDQAQAKQSAVTSSVAACTCGDRSFAILVHDRHGVLVRGLCAACVVTEHVSVMLAAQQAGFDPTSDVADFVADRLDTLEVISAASLSALN